MKRDMDLARQLLLRLEEQHVPAGSALFLSVREPPLLEPRESPDDVHYTMKLLADAGFLDMTNTQEADSFGLRGLSWRGHDFLAAFETTRFGVRRRRERWPRVDSRLNCWPASPRGS